jgi:hypothetical protein
MGGDLVDGSDAKRTAARLMADAARRAWVGYSVGGESRARH